jgi:prolyl-tRNA synthetase
MKMSRLFGTTLRSISGRADAEGHQLLLRAGMIRQLGQGIFSALPLGWRSLRKIEAILSEEQERIGGQELSLPVVQPAEVWQASGRYDQIGPELARFTDRRDRPMVLAMTHEEVVVELCRTEIDSYRDLPRMVFQIQTKFRDDPRPRAGLIRVREFRMKDAYSLDADEAGLHRQYVTQYQAYFATFARCGLPVLAVAADVGMMGGDLAHEYMYLTPVGEDTLVLCDACGYQANRQVATFAKPVPVAEDPLPMEEFETPDATTIDALVALGVPVERTAKALFMAAGAQLIVALVRGDMELNETKLANLVGAADLRPMTEEEIAAIGAVPGYGSPVGVKGATVVVDDLVQASPNLVGGANRAGWHLRQVNAGRDFTVDHVADITAAADGHACVHCGERLRTVRGVEVGNIFKLGERYSAAVGATYLDPDGVRRPVVMGSYGIGVGRLLACVAEEYRDERGLCLPVTIAPYQVHLCQLDGAGSASAEVAARLYDALWAAGVEVLHDDRGQRPGVQFADADLIGAPLRLVVGERGLNAGGVEVRERRGGDSTIVSLSTVVDHVLTRLADLRASYVRADSAPLPPELR